MVRVLLSEERLQRFWRIIRMRTAVSPFRKFWCLTCMESLKSNKVLHIFFMTFPTKRWKSHEISLFIRILECEKLYFPIFKLITIFLNSIGRLSKIIFDFYRIFSMKNFFYFLLDNLVINEKKLHLKNILIYQVLKSFSHVTKIIVLCK